MSEHIIDMERVKYIHMGRVAYERGLPCSPSKDEAFMAALDMLQGKSGYDAAVEAVKWWQLWIHGWQIAQILEGVEG